MSKSVNLSEQQIERIGFSIPDGVDVDHERLQSAASDLVREASTNSVLTDGARHNYKTRQAKGQRPRSGGGTTVVPVSDSTSDPFGFQQTSRFGFTDFDTQYGRFLDSPTIRNLEENTIDYSALIGQWLLEHDDLTPGVIARYQGIILGEEGLGVDPADADSNADTQLSNHLEAVYGNDHGVDLHVSPTDVTEQILADNVRYANSVLRSTDLKPVGVETVREVTDGETGDRIYIQNSTSYSTYDIDDDGKVEEQTHNIDHERALVVGKDVVDAQLYRSPPLAAVAEDIVNKLQLKRLKSRKAEISSIGGIYITVQPPEWLAEEQYTDQVQPDKNPLGDFKATKLELAIQQDIDAALETLQSYQSATIMSLPSHWEVGTVELPEMDESFDDMIRGYNQSISRRLLLPFDLLELERGSELSRESMMGLLGATVSGWQQQIIDVFDAFARIQADIHGINGSVEHTLPRLDSDDETEIVQLLNFAGLLGMSQEEARKVANTLEGVDLEVDTGEADMPPAGGPDQPAARQQSMNEQIQQQNEQMQSSLARELRSRSLDARAQSFSEGDVVEYDEGHTGVVLEVHSSSFEPPGADSEHEVPADETVYVVARDTQGFGTFTESELSGGEFPDDVPGGDLDDVEASVTQASVASYTGMDANAIGFDPGEPEGWTRLSYLKAYSSVGGSFSACTTEMAGDVTDPTRWCAALKDEVYGTTEWR